MVPAKGKYGTVSKGKGVAGAGGGKSGSSAFSTAAAAKVKDIKKENSTSDAEESEDEDAKNVTDFRPLDHTKNMPRFMSSICFTSTISRGNMLNMSNILLQFSVV